MRISMIAWLASTAILTSGAMLAALAQNFKEHPRDRSGSSFVFDPRDLNDRGHERQARGAQ
jgi:hypothetical protein